MKLTPIGFLPEDWDYCQLRDHLDLLTDYDANGSFADMANNVHTEIGSGYAWYVRATDLEQKTPLSEVRYTDKSSYEFLKKSSLFGGEVLVAKRGEIGKVYYFEKPQNLRATLAPNLYLLKLKKSIHSHWLYYFFVSPRGQELLKSINASTSLGAIYKEDVKNLRIPLPNLDEQKKIADALTAVDKMIGALEEAITKKRQIKDGLMQQLLTGKTRLPGFSGKWLPKILGKSALIKARIGWQGLTTKEYLDSGAYYLITGTDFKDGRIDWKNCHYVTRDRFEQDPYIKIQKHDVLVSKDGTIGKVAYLDDIPGPGTLNSGVFVIRSKDKQISQRYLAKVFVSKYFDDFIDSIVAGSTIVHLYQKDIVNFDFMVPPSIEEQEQVCDFLEGVDKEIISLESKRDKYASLKQGMMQELLTGKTRL